MDHEQKRLFFGFEIIAPWPESLPQGRLLDENHRHLTLAFLGKIDYSLLKQALSSFPSPPFKVGFVALFDQCLFLPIKHPHVVAWHLNFLEENALLLTFHKTCINWLKDKGFHVDTRNHFTPHVTLARNPFNKRVWEKKFSPLPAIVKDLHLYESVGNLHYTPLWSLPILAPFEEISHVADVAYLVRGENFDKLYRHAQMALCFSFPPLIQFIQKHDRIENLDDVIIQLNELVTRADQAIGCPFKAVSFHSHLVKVDTIFNWEMIIDV